MKNKIPLFIFVAILFVHQSVSAQFANCCVAPVGPFGGIGVSSTTAEVSWSYYNPVGCPDPIRFKIQYKPLNTAQWQMANSSPYTMSNNWTHVLHNLIPNTQYVWRVRTLCNASSVSAAHSSWTSMQYFSTPMRIGDVNQYQVFAASLFPNPVADNLNISIEGNESTELSIRIFNVMGQTMFEQIIHEAANTFTAQVSLANISSGNYFVEVSGSGRELMKVVKQ